jgi:hypothetical protein
MNRAFAAEAGANWPVAVRTGDLVWVGSIDPQPEGAIEEQCAEVYQTMVDVASVLADGEATQIVRLDHWTQSQTWLAIRQGVRAAFFGRPAPLASAGIPAWLQPGQWLRLSGVAHVSADAVPVLVEGRRFNMPAIATAVSAGPFALFSGILAEPERGATASALSPTEGLSAAVDQLSCAIEAAGLAARHVRRIEVFVGHECSAKAAPGELARTLGIDPQMIEISYGNFDAPLSVEIVALADAADGANNAYVFSPVMAADDLESGLRILHAHTAPLLAEGLQFVRLDIVGMSDATVIGPSPMRAAFGAAFGAALGNSLGEHWPVLVHKPLRCPDRNLSISAILFDPSAGRGKN